MDSESSGSLKMIERIPNWESALSDYILSKRDEPFVYGQNDCCMFAAGAMIVITGIDPIPEFRGKYKSLTSSIKALKEFGAGDLEKTIDGKLPEIPVGLARRGDVAFYDGSLGVVMDGYAWFVSDDGLERIPRSEWTKAWSIGRG
jgi:hypothetical protein